MSILETDDITLAATLLSKGVEYSTIKKVGNRGTFVYNLSEEDRKYLIDYAVNEVLVEPKSFHAAIRTLSRSIRIA